MIVSSLLLMLEEEDAFWMMSSIVEELLPASYFSPSLVGIQADQVRRGTMRYQGTRTLYEYEYEYGK